jgi:hypothetical protein
MSEYLQELITELKTDHAKLLIDIANHVRHADADKAAGNTGSWRNGIVYAKQEHADYVSNLIAKLERKIWRETK